MITGMDYENFINFAWGSRYQNGDDLRTSSADNYRRVRKHLRHNNRSGISEGSVEKAWEDFNFVKNAIISALQHVIAELHSQSWPDVCNEEKVLSEFSQKALRSTTIAEIDEIIEKAFPLIVEYRAKNRIS